MFGRGSFGQFAGHFIGGFGVGFIEKTFPGIPSVPIVGKKGAIAIAAHLFGNRHPLIRDVGLSAAAISGYELGSTGKITGVDGDEDGIAAQM